MYTIIIIIKELPNIFLIAFFTTIGKPIAGGTCSKYSQVRADIKPFIPDTDISCPFLRDKLDINLLIIFFTNSVKIYLILFSIILGF